jgi:hypothetical protein
MITHAICQNKIMQNVLHMHIVSLQRLIMIGKVLLMKKREKFISQNQLIKTLQEIMLIMKTMIMITLYLGKGNENGGIEMTTEKVEWAERRMRLRRRIVRIMDRLRDDGEIDSLDLDRLYNYCMVMLMLLGRFSPAHCGRR